MTFAGLPHPEYEPVCFDDNPITPEEEVDLRKSWEELQSGEFTVVPRSCTGEEFLKMLDS